MAIIVGDIHGNHEKARAFLNYRSEQEHIALGDYLDSFLEPAERQLETLELLMSSKAVLLWGNHDLHYLDYPQFQFAGYNLAWAGDFGQVLEKNIDRFVPSYLADGWLCTHAGVNSALVHGRSAQELDRLFCESWEEYLMDRAAGGKYRFKSIFTFDFLSVAMLVSDSIRQVHGHDEHSVPEFIKPNCVSIGCNDNGSAWIFDTETSEIKNLGEVT